MAVIKDIGSDFVSLSRLICASFLSARIASNFSSRSLLIFRSNSARLSLATFAFWDSGWSFSSPSCP